MSSYIKDFDWEQYETEEDWDKYYAELEEKDKVKSRKHQTKLRTYEGYVENIDD